MSDLSEGYEAKNHSRVCRELIEINFVELGASEACRPAAQTAGFTEDPHAYSM